MSEIRYLERGGTRLAYRHRQGAGPGVIFLPGYMSDMEGSKACALDAWAQREGRAFLRFDYAGRGESDGEFEAQTLATYRSDVLAMIDEVMQGPVVLVGSSMGGWLMLLAALARPDRVAGLIGIAAAPDFTIWGFTDEQKRRLESEGRIEEPSEYGDYNIVTTRNFVRSGDDLKLLDRDIDIGCPVRLLHGQADTDVPWQNSLQLAERLRSADVQTILVKGGDHRLSRDEDIALLVATVSALMEPM